MKVILKLIICLPTLLFFCCKSKQVTVDGLRCEYQVSPIHIDVQSPRFNWKYSAETSEGFKQKYHQLEIGKTSKDVESNVLLWNSGKIENPKGLGHFASDNPLESHQWYYWRVRIWDDSGNENVSAIDSFRTAKINQTDWKAAWISDKHDKSFGPAPMFRKQFAVKKPVKSAFVYVSAAAYYDLKINGKASGPEVLDPGYTHYDKRNIYSVKNVSHLIQQGENVLNAVVGNGFFNADAPVATWDFEKARWRNRAQWIMELHLAYADGTQEIISTDETWKTNTGPHVYNNIYSGEWYDANLEFDGWDQPSFDDSKWDHAIQVKAPSNLLIAQAMPPMKMTKTYDPVSIKSFGDSVYVFDMGINFTGVCELIVEGEKGTKVTLTHGELIKPSGRIEMRNLDIYYKPIKDVEFQTDTYILKGIGKEHFTPSFTYHGFRYVEVKTSKPLNLTKESLIGKFIHTDMEDVGEFSCSNELLNKIWSATKQTYLNNVQGIPTDCPQREKNGWTADGYLAIDIALLNYDALTFYEKWLDDFVDNQKPEGNISGIIPSAGWGYDDWIGPVWDAAMFILPDALERYYGDAKAIEKVYASCERYLAYLKNRENAEGTVTWGIGDWVFYKAQTPTDFTSTCFYYYDQVLMAKFSKKLGKDASVYLKKAAELKDLINRKYLNQEKGMYANGTQTSYAVPLALGIVPTELEGKIAENLNKAVASNDYHLDFGVLGSKYVLRMLSKYGYAETAYKMASKETAPSWGYWIKQGLNTLGETWVLSPDFRDASINHVFLGDVSAWMVNTIAGINYDENRPGFDHIIIKPDYIQDLQFAKASYKSVKGLIIADWKRVDGKIKLSVEIPPNSTATIHTDKKIEVGSGKHEFTF